MGTRGKTVVRLAFTGFIAVFRVGTSKVVSPTGDRGGDTKTLENKGDRTICPHVPSKIVLSI